MKKPLILIIALFVSANTQAQEYEIDSVKSFVKEDAIHSSSPNINEALKDIADAEAMISGIGIHFPNKEQFKNAKELFLKSFVERDDYYLDYFIYYELGYCEQNLENYPKAVEYYSQCLRIMTDTSYFGRRNCYLKIDSFYFTHYNTFLPFGYKKYQLFKNRGLCKFNLFDYRGAISDFTESIKLEGENIYTSYSYAMRGACKYYLADYLSAKEDFNSALRLNDNDGYSYLHRGLTNLKLSQSNQACNDFSKAGEFGEEDAYSYIKIYCK